MAANAGFLQFSSSRNSSQWFRCNCPYNKLDYGIVLTERAAGTSGALRNELVHFTSYSPCHVFS